MIKILIVDDSAIIRMMLKQIIAKSDELEVIGEANNGQVAVELTKNLHPDVIIMDIYMPVMDGLEATRQIMKDCPTAILVFTTEDVARIGFKAIEAGAVDILPKPELEQLDSRFSKLFLQKIASVSDANLTRKFSSSNFQPESSGQIFNIVCIGASTGGPIAVQTVLKSIPKDFKVPILITQHIDESFDNHYASWLSESSEIDVTLASDGIIPLPGHAYVAPADKHLVVSPTASGLGVLRLTDDPPVHFLRPAVDPLFSSAAKVYKSTCLAVLLTGMGKDGAVGCAEIRKEGGFTIAESEKTCVVYGMPRAAIESNAISRILDLNEIGPLVVSFIGRKI